MLSVIPVLLGLTALVSARCGTGPPSESMKALHAGYQAQRAGGAKGPLPRQVVQFDIDTYVHVILGDNGEGDVPESQINDQITILNEKYASTGFYFTLQPINYVTNQEWRSIAYQSDTEYEMKSTLRQGRYQDLNIYLDTIAPANGMTLLGYATFPDSASDKTFSVDGVVLDPATLPGGTPPYDLGITAVHEVGHWLSLFHTFESFGDQYPNGCYGPGDYISDTPFEASAAFGCDMGRDTCSQPGLDPIHNYMDYSDDSCLSDFSDEQVFRMQMAYTDVRVAYIPGNGGETGDQSPGTGGSHGG